MRLLSPDGDRPGIDRHDEQEDGPVQDQAEPTTGRRQLSEADKDLLRRIDPGAKALVIAGVMLVLVICSVLPWIGDAAGWQVMLGETDPALQVTLLPRLFAVNSTVAGVLLSALALATRRWALAWVAAMACVVVAFEGLTAIWSRQTVPVGGPSIGLVLAAVCMAVLAFQWLRVVLTRP